MDRHMGPWNTEWWRYALFLFIATGQVLIAYKLWVG